jgi:hypothetical protein
VSSFDSPHTDERPRSSIGELASCLVGLGYVHIAGGFAFRGDAWATAMSVAMCARSRSHRNGLQILEAVGEFNLPPEGAAQRDFQALHIDGDRTSSNTATRVVPLRQLLRQRTWPAPSTVIGRLRGSGEDAPTEGIFARIIEAVDDSADLPAKDGEFLCGMEFNSIDDERSYYRRHGIELNSAERRIILGPGDLNAFDNQAVAHGRSGRRPSRELHQLCIGLAADRAAQAQLLDELAARFATDAPIR